MRKVKLFLHRVVGHILCRMHWFCWDVRDILSPPKETSVLFVTHPDDDTLFFHTFIKKHKPYVVVMTAGHSVNRLRCFLKNMKRYGVRCRAYDQGTDDTREHVVRRHVRHVLAFGKFVVCATHNAQGEYGHPMHICVHNAVIAESPCPVWVPESANAITEFPITTKDLAEKRDIFTSIYTSELFVLDLWPNWMAHEHLVKYNPE